MTIAIKEIIGGLAALIGLINIGIYFLTIIRGQITPHFFTWVIWTFTNAIIFAAQYLDAGGPGAWQTGVTSIACGVIAITAISHGEHNITRTDWAAFVCALGALPIWFLTHNPLASVLTLTVVDSIGFYPTFRKAFQEPYRENAGWTFSAAFVYSLSIMALTNYDWTTLLYPVAMIGWQGGLGVMLLWRRSTVKKN